mmetsp:Transcript_22669/g.68245  ORF Transcript_22669/g.68245 Transcript_22669/m.68245 type:complete len:1363 (+) Transcript_22669:58-4146(+)|eukprot:CAMPEP_0206288684 /NCGR_PEP_ID=MMETSP0106_2-20121207/1739_1 /ASSEMBLY_ACC=CAM_ASM_000206 /TAXON_ID=81532 /ORGANISM="Acanthoeca-like sp., Strain 10tr" /LENGTH=1362 /DNA_ID=CAMNT_0053719237 /DNA_START=158 /DNA_END=4246 /DNA_ORIENTATION=+
MTSILTPARLQASFDRIADDEGILALRTVEDIINAPDFAARYSRQALDDIRTQLLTILDDNSDGSISFTEYRMAFDMYPIEMITLFGSEDDKNDLRDALTVFDAHANGNAALTEAYCRSKIAATMVGKPRETVQKVQDAYLELLECDGTNHIITITNFVMAYFKRTAEIYAIFGPDVETEPEETEIQAGPADREDWDYSSSFTSNPGFQEAADELLEGHRDASQQRMAGMSQTKLNALRRFFDTADKDGGNSIGADELYSVLQDEDLGGELAISMRKELASFSSRFVRNMFEKLDQNGDGNFTFDEFAEAFSPIINDEGEYTPETSISGAQLHALKIEYGHLAATLANRDEELADVKGNLGLKLQAEENLIKKLVEYQNDAENAADVLEKDNTRLRGMLKKEQATVSSLEATIEEHEKTIDDLRKQLAKSRTAMLQLPPVAVEETDDLSQQLANARELAEQLRQSLDAATTAHDAYRRETDQRIAKLEADLISANRRVSTLQQIADESGDMEARLVASEEENSRLKNQVAELLAAAERPKNELETLKKGNADAEEKFQKDIDNLQRQLSAAYASTELRDQVTELNKYRAAVDALVHEVSMIRQIDDDVDDEALGNEDARAAEAGAQEGTGDDNGENTTLPTIHEGDDDEDVSHGDMSGELSASDVAALTVAEKSIIMDGVPPRLRRVNRLLSRERVASAERESALRQKLDDEIARVSTLEAEKAQMSTELSTLRDASGQVEELTAEIAGLQAQLAKVNQGAQDDAATLLAAHNEITMLGTKLTAAQAELDKAAAENNDLKDTVQGLRRGMDKLKAELTSAQELAIEAEGRADKLAREVKDGKQDVEDLENSMHDLQEKNQDLLNQASDLEDTVDALRDDISELKKRLTSAQSTSMGHKNEADSERLRAERLQQQVDRLVQEKAGLTDRLRQSDDDLSAAQRKYIAAEVDAKEAERTAARVRRELSTLRISAEGLRQCKDACEKDLDRIDSDLQRERDESSRLRRELFLTQMDLKSTRGELAGLQAVVDSTPTRRHDDSDYRPSGVSSILDGFKAALQAGRESADGETRTSHELHRVRSKLKEVEGELETTRDTLSKEQRGRHAAEALLKAADADTEHLEAEIQDLRQRVASSESRSELVNAEVVSLRTQLAVLGSRLAEGEANAGAQWSGDGGDAERVRLVAVLEASQAKVLKLETTIKQLLKELAENHARKQPIIVQSSPPAVEKPKPLPLPPPKKKTRRATAHVHRTMECTGVTVMQSRLAQQLGLSGGVANIQVSEKGFALLDTANNGLRWPFGDVERYGVERGLFSVELGALSRTPGVLHFLAHDRAPALLHAFRKFVGGTNMQGSYSGVPVSNRRLT